MLRLDYISCGLTVASTLLVGRKRLEGWIVAGLNSILICVIGWKTSQLGFIPANLFALRYMRTTSEIGRGFPRRMSARQVTFNRDLAVVPIEAQRVGYSPNKK